MLRGNHVGEPGAEIVADPAERVEPLLVSLHSHRILEIAMMALRRPRKQGAAPVSGAAHRHDIVERLRPECIDVLRSVSGNVDPDFPQHRDRFSPDEGRMRAGADDLDPVPEVVAEQSFRHLISGAVAGAQDKGAAFHEQQVGPQQAAAAGLRARTNAEATLPLTSGAIASTSRPDSARNARASSTS